VCPDTPAQVYNRPMLISALASILLLAAPVRAAEPPLLEVVGRRTIAPSAFVPVSNAAITAPLALVVENGSGWDAPGVLEAVLGKASAIFARCGVALGSAEVSFVRWSPEGLRRLNIEDPYKGPAQIAVMGEPLLPVRRPAGFLFAAKSIPSTASAYNVRSVEAMSRQTPAVKSMLNTFWITMDQQNRRPADFAESYSMFAHELTHIFGNLPHTPASPNLMTDAQTPRAKSGDLLEEQCVEIRKLYGL
jgi:hypothetical protein